MVRTTRIRFDGYKRDYEVPGGFRTVELTEIYVGMTVWIIGTRNKSIFDPKLGGAAYGPHTIKSIHEESGSVILRNSKGRSFDSQGLYKRVARHGVQSYRS
jgi:hypothetical protein